MHEADAGLARLVERVTDLEIKAAFQESLLIDLDDVLRTLRDEVEDLRRAVIAIAEQLEAGEQELTDEPPPHY